jgi:hypothetical protein
MLLRLPLLWEFQNHNLKKFIIMQRIFKIAILLFFGCSLSAQIGDSIKVPKSLISEISRYTGQTLVDVPISLTTLRTEGINSLSIIGQNGFNKREVLVSLQTSPYDEQYFGKSLLVGRNYIAEIKTNWAGEQVIIFKRKR